MPSRYSARQQALADETFCSICASTKGKCGNFEMNHRIKQILWEIFEWTTDADQMTICVPCLEDVHHATEFRKLVKKADEVQENLEWINNESDEK